MNTRTLRQRAMIRFQSRLLRHRRSRARLQNSSQFPWRKFAVRRERIGCSCGSEWSATQKRSAIPKILTEAPRRITVIRLKTTSMSSSDHAEIAKVKILQGALPVIEPPAEEAESAIPGLLRPDGIVLGAGDAARPDGGLVGEGMACEVAVEVERHAGFAQLVLQRIDGGDGEELVLRGPMRQQRRLDLGRIDVFERRAAVPDHAGVDLGG